MKKISLHLFYFLLFLCGFITMALAQEKKQNKETRAIYYKEDEPEKDFTWKRKGFEVYIGGGAYFASKKTANYYNGAPENEFNVNLLLDNQYYRDEILRIMREAYRYNDTIALINDFNQNSAYNVAMDIALGGKYRFNKNWYIELSYSFRRVSVQNYFSFYFPGGIIGNMSPSYSRNQSLLAKEDRHYIDFSIGYIFQKHNIIKPFISVGIMFTYIEIKHFDIFIENQPFDLLQIARYPNYIPNVQDMPNYRAWSGAGYGCSLTAGLKIACGKMVSLDPVFQVSAASFGNSSNLPGYNTKICFNYLAGVRLVMNDALFTRNK